MMDDKNKYINKSSRDAYGMAFYQQAKLDDRIVAITADVPDSVRFSKFRESWPERFFNFWIAEQNMMGAAAGFAREGKVPFVSVYAIFAAMRALPFNFNDEPERAMRPFDADREGFVAAQGSAMFVLESLAHAQKRGARIYAEILGFGTSNDAFHMIAPDPEGNGAALAIRRALASAGVGIEAVDYINAHGTSTPLGDVAETKAIKQVFGEQAYEIPISSTKSMIGHMMGATGAVELMACVRTIQEGIIHPTINYETPDPECDLDYVPNKARQAEVNTVVSNSFGLGGQNAVLVLGAYGA